jgi:hypothetical protein
MTLDDFQTQIASQSQLILDSENNLGLTNIFNLIVSKFNEIMGIVFEQGLLRITQIFTDKLTTKELCVDDICVTKDQLKTLLEQNGLMTNAPTPTPSQSPVPDSSPDSTQDLAPEESETEPSLTP